MKPSTQKSYFDRIDRVVGYLNQQVEATPSLAELANIAAISPFHFHRVYRAITGETPSGTLRRLRLVRALHLLKDPKKPITEIAFEVGYDSSQAFSKAFREGTGHSPSVLREKPVKLGAILKGLSTPPEIPRKGPGDLVVKVVSLEPFKVIAARHLGPHKGLFQAYGEFFAWAEKSGLVESFKGIYGIPIDDPRGIPENECRFDCCFDFGADVKPGDGYREEFLGDGLYAVIRHLGHYDGLDEKYDYLYGPWLKASGYFLRDAPFFNHYLQDPETLPPEQWETDIYLPVEKGETK